MVLRKSARTLLGSAAFTLVEVVMAIAILALVFGGIILGYVQTLHRAEWSAYSLAASSLAQMKLEQVRSAKWDTLAVPPVDEVTQANFPPEVEILDVPISGTNFVLATNFTTITQPSVNPPYRAIQVDCVWAYHNGRVFTNTMVTYRAPDQ